MERPVGPRWPAERAESRREGQRRLEASGQKRPRLYTCILCPTRMYWEGVCRWCQNWRHARCAQCDAGKRKRKLRSVTEFSNAELQRWSDAPGRTRNPYCRRCERPTPTGRRRCKECGKEKSRNQIRHWNPVTNTGVCRVCVKKATKVSKKCSQCNALLPKRAKPEAWCQNCAFPPCQGGCGRPRPQKRGWHAKTKAQWVCQACAPATRKCVKCGGALGKGRKDKREAWCQECAYPPCHGGCGKARPRKHPYHAKNKPSWTCLQCK